jgi:hypothetical protein
MFVGTIVFILLVVGGSSFKMPDGLVSLRNIVSSRAILSSLAQEVYHEFVDVSFATMEVSSGGSHWKTSLLYGAMLVASLIFQYKSVLYFENKWKNLEGYSSTRKVVNNLLVVFMIVFTKNVENAI